MKRWLGIVSALLLAFALAACGGDDNGDTSPEASERSADAPVSDAQASGPTATPVPTGTPRPPSPRNLAPPAGDPQAFEAPFSAGKFTRESLAGNVVSPQTGGQRVVYSGAGGTVVLTLYRFPTAAEATQTVTFTLSASSIDTLLTELYTAPAASFGIARDRHGGLIAAWSRGEWAYIARTTGERALLDEFLSVFPY